MLDPFQHDELQAILAAYFGGHLGLAKAAERVVAITYESGWSLFANDIPEQPDQVARAEQLAAEVQRLITERLQRERRSPPWDPRTA
jgi:hypothetical protein